MNVGKSLQLSLRLGLLLICTGLLPAHAQEDLEDKVKAAFVYNFAKFVDWPADSTAAGDFQICVAGQDSLGSKISRTLEGKTLRNRTIRVRPISWTTDELTGCHMLYLNGSGSPNVERMLDAAQKKPILTIGEGENFNRNGGIIRFLLVDGKVRFTINQAAARTSGLNISAKLLEVAFRVRQEQSSYTGAQRKEGDVLVS